VFLFTCRSKNKRPLICCVALVGCIHLYVTAAQAETPKIVGSVGVKGAIGGNHIKEADGLGPYQEDLSDDENLYPFYHETGGTGGGGGIFGELRFFREHFAVEAGLLFDANKNWKSLTAEGVKVDYILKYSVLRIPLLLKANFVTGRTRFGVGFGPEFRFGLKSSAEIELIEGEENIPETGLTPRESQLSTHDRNDVALVWDVALAFATGRFEVTLDLRLAYNLTWPDAYPDRVNIAEENQDWFYTFEAGHLAEGRMLLGVAYVFPNPVP
jgi:hypothetical protein